jgi:hypothetical protein
MLGQREKSNGCSHWADRTRYSEAGVKRVNHFLSTWASDEAGTHLVREIAKAEATIGISKAK